MGKGHGGTRLRGKGRPGFLRWLGPQKSSSSEWVLRSLFRLRCLCALGVFGLTLAQFALKKYPMKG